MTGLPRGLTVLAVAVLLAIPGAAWACPQCEGVQVTLADEIKGSEVAVIAKVIQRTPDEKSKPVTLPIEVPKTRFKILKVINGAEELSDIGELEVLYFGQEPAERLFLIQAASLPELTSLPELNWRTPLPLSERAATYVQQLSSLPEKGGDRLAFFQDYFEDSDDLLARDAYNEFGKAPFSEVKELKDRMHHDKYVAWIQDPNTVTNRRRLYLVLLGVCGRDHDKRTEDIAMLEDLIKAEGDDPRPALDAIIACYLTLTEADGMPLVEDLFLKNKECSYSDTYAAVLALRFHGQEETILPRDRLLAGMRCLLDRPELADLIIPDLARWQDWSAIDRLVKMFKEADQKSSWVRQPVLQYLMACPKPEAKEHVAELTKIDPEAAKRASFFIPLGSGKPAPVPAAGPSGAGTAVPVDSPKAGNTSAAEKSSAAPRKVQFRVARAALPPPSPQVSKSGNLPATEPAGGHATGGRQRAIRGSWLVVAVPAAAGIGLLGLLVVTVRPGFRKSGAAGQKS